MKEIIQDQNEKPDETLVEVAKLVKETGKPVISVSIGSDFAHKKYSERYGIVSFPTPERAVRVLKNMVYYQHYLKSI